MLDLRYAEILPRPDCRLPRPGHLSARQQQHLRAAIESRQIIGEAIGILRIRSNLSSQQAFEMLSEASKRTNIMLRELAQ